jgi:pimeloyl-ACP methyl ester carboxylesterase
MVKRELKVRSGKVAVIEAGSGAPLVYLHGFADVHGVSADFLPFHEGLAQNHRVIAPAHPACNGSDELSDGNRVEVKLETSKDAPNVHAGRPARRRRETDTWRLVEAGGRQARQQDQAAGRAISCVDPFKDF